MMQIRLCFFLSLDILASVIKQKLEIDFINSQSEKNDLRYQVTIVTSILILRKVKRFNKNGNMCQGRK